MGTEIVIVDAIRTAITNLNGGFANIPGHELGAFLIKTIIDRNKIDSKEVDEVILGQVLYAAQGQNPARQAALKAGLDYSIPAWGVNQVCGSGLKAVILATQSIMSADSKIVIAGGQENMSMAPHAIKLRDPIKFGNGVLIDTMVNDGLTDAFHNYPMGITAENIAKKFNISRLEQDEFSVKSQNKAEQAQKEGRFKEEIIPFVIKNKKGDTIVDKDEFPRHGTTIDSLSNLKSAFDKEGTVTAGNASGINDGAAILLIMKKDEAEKRGLKPMAKIVSFAKAGVDPAFMGTGPIYAVKKALSKANWSVKDLNLIESNEAFAAQAICVKKELGFNDEIVNVNGGAIALGHPIGASGARILVTLLHEMQKRDAKRGLATLCVGGGMGVAICVEV